ncbi:hypothetical protein ACVIRO_001259 [Rhizobium ruizarguesonis]|uniref:hypothetical protein n=1 Tax=Rhizobium leguminosarum TaxID=384 RepID=UPI0004801BBC|nr:hypothetical protein [Rhizobium leguminosarum]
MAKAPVLVDGIAQPDIEDVLDSGKAVAVSSAGPVQGEYALSTEAKNILDWEVISLDGKSHGHIRIVSN